MGVKGLTSYLKPRIKGDGLYSGTLYKVNHTNCTFACSAKQILNSTLPFGQVVTLTSDIIRVVNQHFVSGEKASYNNLNNGGKGDYLGQVFAGQVLVCSLLI